MKTRLLLAFTLLIAIFSGGCSGSGDRETAKELLSMIPGEASYVAIVNTESLVTSTGGKVNDKTVIEPSEVLMKFLREIDKTDSPAHIDSIFSGKAGIEFSCFSLFESEGNLWLCAPLADPDLTRSYLSKQGYDLQSAGDGLMTAQDVVLDQSHLWLSLKDSGKANAAAVSDFKRLNKEQSILSSGYSDQLSSLDSDYIDLWDSNILWRTLGPSADQARMVSAFIFEDGRYASFSADMGEKSLIATGRFLNSNFKDAKCNLATKKLSTRDFDILGDKAQAVAGLSLDSKMMKNISKAIKAFGGALPPAASDLLNSIEGSLVLASDEANNIILSIPCKKGKEETVRKSVENLSFLLGDTSGIRLTTKEKSVLVSFNGGPQSGISIKQLGEKLDGAFLGMALSSGYFPKVTPIESLSIALVPVNSSLEYRIRLDY